MIAPISLDGLASGDAAIAAMPATRRAGSKPVAIEGLNEYTGEWEPAVPGQRYGAFQAGVQLANRTGALNEIEYSEFVVKAQAFADAVNGAPEFPEMLDEVGAGARARPVRQRARRAAELRAARAAMRPGAPATCSRTRRGWASWPASFPAAWCCRRASRACRRSWACPSTPRPRWPTTRRNRRSANSTLSLDVPQVDRAERPFERMREAAATLAREMDGVVTDGDGQLLREDTMDVIGADLEQLYDTLDSRDLSAGSPLARRLFS